MRRQRPAAILDPMNRTPWGQGTVVTARTRRTPTAARPGRLPAVGRTLLLATAVTLGALFAAAAVLWFSGLWTFIAWLVIGD